MKKRVAALRGGSVVPKVVELTGAARSADPTAREPNHLRVLLVEQDTRVAGLVRRRFRYAAARALTLDVTDSIAAACECLPGGTFDAVLIGLLQSDGDALEAVRELRGLDVALPIIVLCGHGARTAPDAALAAGADDYLNLDGDDGAAMVRTLRYAIERKYTSRHLAYLAHYDKLTGLPNRDLFRERVQQAVQRAECGDRTVAVLSLDLDRFKSINETLGHGAGDELLITVAYRLGGCTGKGDTIARVGSDEFAILLEDLSDQRAIEPLCQGILAAMAEPVVVRGEEIYVTLSIGVSFFPLDANEVGELMRKADHAMHRAKSDGRGRFCLFSPALHTALSETIQLEAALRRALVDDALYLCYQPKLCLQTGNVLGAEALLRWRHPRLGTIMPTRFVPLAEDSGLIVPIGEWVLRRACEDLRRWRELGYDGLTMAVNLSTRQFRRGDLARVVEGIIDDTGTDPNQLTLEITESLLLEDSEHCRGQLDALKAMGVTVYLDDFGTGYSSLSYLKRFRIDGLKIDRSFIRDLPGDGDEEAIVRAILALGRALRLGVIAEGVENHDQLDLLVREGCDAVQGFLFAEPLRFDDFVAGLPGGFSRGELALVGGRAAD